MPVATTSGSTFLHPENILAKAGLVAGKTVADLGCGGGYFVLAAARIVGDQGLVYGVDILKDALSSVESKAMTFGLSNIKTVWSNVEIFGGARDIKDNSVDYVVLAQLLSQSKNHKAIFKEVLRILKTGGTLIVVDWHKNNLKLGPTNEERITVEQAQAIAVANNFILKREIEAGPYHYGLIFEKK